MNRLTSKRIGLALVMMAGIPGGEAGAEDTFTFIRHPGQVDVRLGAHPLATYVYRDPDVTRPYFKDLFAPGGIRVSRHHPPRGGLDPTDHDNLHPGLWLAFGDLNGADCWRNKTPVEHVEFTQPPIVRDNVCRFAVRNRYTDGTHTICEEVCEITFLLRPAGVLLLWNSAFRSDERDFWFGDQEEMGLGVRVATPMMVKPRKADSHITSNGRILDSEGRRNEPGIWGKPALWCDYSGIIGDSFVGITIMPDPQNHRASRWHARNYGFMAANAFATAAFKVGAPSKTIVPRGQNFRLGYGVLLHANASESNLSLAEAYRDVLSVMRGRGRNVNGGGAN